MQTTTDVTLEFAVLLVEPQPRIRRKLSATVVQDIPLRPRTKAVLIATAVVLFAFIFISCASPGPATEQHTAPLVDDRPIGRAFATRASDIQVEGEGTVIRVLPDDLNEPRGTQLRVIGERTLSAT